MISFSDSLARASECLVWTGAVGADGHGLVRTPDGLRRVERVAFYLAHRRWPRKLVHSCGTVLCCRPEHLKDAFDPYRPAPKPGESNGNSKLSANQVREIIDIYNAKTLSQRAIAQLYGVNQSQVSKIVSGRQRATDTRGMVCGGGDVLR